MKKKISSNLLVLAGVLFFVFGFSFFQQNTTLLKTKVADAASTDNLVGWAWANTPQSSGTPTTGTNQGVGWISFNSTNCDTDGNGFVDSGVCGGDNSSTAVVPYGVNVDPTTGDFIGNAWSPNVGWVSFNRADTGNPPSGPYNTGSGPIANLNLSTKVVTGWVRVLSGIGSNAGNMDGWIKLSGTATDGSSYGVKLNTSGNFTGYAWGGVVIGWVDFNPTVNGVSYGVSFGTNVNQAPDNPVVTAPATGYVNTPISFTVSAYDPNNDNVQYEVDWKDGSSKTYLPSATTYTPNNTSLTASHTWTSTGSKTIQVRAKDNKGAYSSLTYKTINITVVGTGVGTGSSGSGTCGNGVCGATENFVTCPLDCQAKLKEI